jgi:NADH:ubiquinone oxidoreductase subunit E
MKEGDRKSPPKRKGSTGESAIPLKELKQIVDANTGKAGSLIRVLQQAQGLMGYLPPPMLTAISKEMRVPPSEVSGIVSFYSFFTTVPRGKHVMQVCLGTSCYVRGGQGLIDALKKQYKLEPGETTADGLLSLDTVRCLGACALAPVATLDGHVHPRVKRTGVQQLLSQCK